MSKIEAWAVVDTQGKIVATWDTHAEALYNCHLNNDTGECRIIRLIPESEATTANGEARTLRDWFAGLAMQGMLNGVVGVIGVGTAAEVSAYAKGHCNSAVVDRAYTIADEMLSGRASRAAQPAMTEQEVADAIAREQKGGA